MKRHLFVSGVILALSAVSAAPLAAQDVPHPDNPNGVIGKDVRPGAVGPGSEKNAEIAPTSPSIPIERQPPAEIPANAGASGASTGESGSPGPYNPTQPIE